MKTHSPIVSEKEPIAVVCPSFGKRCGIARYSDYVADALGSVGHCVKRYSTVRSAYEDMPKYKFGKVLIQHEYGLFDDLNPYLSAGETTSDIVVFGLLLRNNYPDTIMYVVVHSYVTHELVHKVANQQLMKAGIIPVVLNAAGAHIEAINHLEHGVLNQIHTPQVTNNASRVISRLKIGTFGFLKGNRGIDDLLDIVQASNAKLVAVLACDDPRARAEFQRKLDERHIVSDVSYDFLEEDEVLRYIEQADCFISLQSEIAHWGTTGSVRFLMQLGKPIFVYPHRQFYDMLDGVKFITKESVRHELVRISDTPSYRAELSSNVQGFANDNRIAAAYQRLFHPPKTDKENRKDSFARALGEPSNVKVASVYALAWLPQRALATYLDRLGLGHCISIFEGRVSPQARHQAISEFLSCFQSRLPDGHNIHFSLARTVEFNDLAGPDYLPLAMMNKGISFVRAIISLLYRRDVLENDFNLLCEFETYAQKYAFMELLDYSKLNRTSIEHEILTQEEYGAAEDRLKYAYGNVLRDHPYFMKDESPVVCGWELVGLGRTDFELKVKSLGLNEDAICDIRQSNNIQFVIQQAKAANWPTYWSDPLPRLIQPSRRHYWITEFLYTTPDYFGVQIAKSFFKRPPFVVEYESAVAAARKGIDARIDLILDALEMANRFDEFFVHGLEQDSAVWKRCASMKGSFFGDQDEIDLSVSNFLLVLRVLTDRSIGQLK